MKKLILLIGVLAFANDTKEILKMINILQAQHSIYKPIKNLYNPFYSQKNNIKATNTINFNYNLPTNTKKTYNLEIIFQNKVRINNKWYKNNDKIDNYKVFIKNEEVYLINKNKTIHLKRKTFLKVTK